MTRFGIIAEGITDQIVIKNILMGYFTDLEPDDVVELQPQRKKGEESFGNWELVFAYCQSEKLKQAFQFVDYIIIHIDTDVCDRINFDVPKYEAGKELSVEELRDRVRQKLIGFIGEEFYSKFAPQFFFAIAIHSLECWLLPLYCTDIKQAAQTKNCEKRLRRVLTGELAKFSKSQPDYDRLSENYYLNPEKLTQYYPKNPSLKIFIEEIQTRKITLEI